MFWLIALGVLIALAVMPIGVRACYYDGAPRAWVYFGPIKISLYPIQNFEKIKTKLKIDPAKKSGSEKKKEENKEKEKKEKKEVKEVKKIEKDSIEGFLAILKTILDFVTEFRTKLWVRRLHLKLILASQNPCSLAMNYGRAWAILGNLMPVLERYFRIKKRNLEVECDFTATETVVQADVDLMIPVFRIASLLVRYSLRGLKQILKLDIIRKGGATNEPKSP